ncbi:Protein of unknown function [Pyronema omphalodes CBS 100304]|uniref:Uncharacterized protein n=1 Tax=Pyronema omphalodes (strain CBS 100304) TaxID=1076935 RepID=U4LSS6_PYROM|nr:Protein of unknown function [Pyronema omphalodes CBS 100304]
MPSLTPLGLCTSCPRHEASRAPINTVPVPPSNPSTECVLCMKSDSSSATLYARKIAPESVQNNSSDNLTTSQVIGISLGIALIFLIALICWYLMAQKSKKKAADEERERAWIPPNLYAAIRGRTLWWRYSRRISS